MNNAARIVVVAVVAVLASACSIEKSCIRSQYREATCAPILSACEGGSLDSCALLGNVWDKNTPVRLRALLAGCAKPRGSVFCGELAEAVQSEPKLMGDATIRDALTASCEQHHSNANACWIAGHMALRSSGSATGPGMNDWATEDRASVERARALFQIGCDSSVQELRWIDTSGDYCQSVGPAGFCRVDTITNPRRSCESLHRFSPRSAALDAALRERAAELHEEQGRVFRASDARDAREQQELRAQREEDERQRRILMGIRPEDEPGGGGGGKAAGRGRATSAPGGQPGRSNDRQKPITPDPELERLKTAQALGECLAEPITQQRVTQTNPFLAEEGVYRSILTTYANGLCKQAARWETCMGEPNMSALWAVDARVSAEQDDLQRRFAATGASSGAPACGFLMGMESTRSYCLTMGQKNCADRLAQNIANVHCDYELLPHVWENENARKDAAAKRAHDDECRRRYR